MGRSLCSSPKTHPQRGYTGSVGLRLGKAEPFLSTPFSETGGWFSPDGRWLAYNSNMSGTFEVYVRPFPVPAGGRGGLWQVSTGGARWPLWSSDGRELFFVAADGRVMAVSYTAKGETFTVGKPRVWTDARVNYSSGQWAHDIAPDGKRAAALLADDVGDSKLPASLTVLVNFTDELRRKAPAGK